MHQKMLCYGQKLKENLEFVLNREVEILIQVNGYLFNDCSKSICTLQLGYTVIDMGHSHKLNFQSPNTSDWTSEVQGINKMMYVLKVSFESSEGDAHCCFTNRGNNIWKSETTCKSWASVQGIVFDTYCCEAFCIKMFSMVFQDLLTWVGLE
jgi:hypothetical protein